MNETSHASLQQKQAVMGCEAQLAGQLYISKTEIEQGLTSHQTHYRSYRGRVFTGQMTKPTVSKH